MGLRELLRREMARRRINQKQAAEEMGVSQPVLSRWMADGDLVPSAENCARIAEFLRQPVVTVLRLAGRIPSDDDTPPEDMEWEMLMPDLREVFGPDRTRWRGKLDLFRAVDRVATLPERNPEDEAETDGKGYFTLSLPSGFVPQYART